MIDLHVHTHHSDGFYTPEEVVGLAKTNGVSVMAITDHDGIDGVAAAMAAGLKYGVRVIPGIEISAINKGGNMHILGYNMDLENAAFKNAVELMRHRRADRNRRLLTAFAEIGVPMTEAEVRKYCDTDYMGKTHMALVLLERGLVKDAEEAFNSASYFDSMALRQIRREKVSPEEGIQIILAAGGIPVLAHPHTLNLGMEQLDEKILELKCFGMKGLECYHSDHDGEDTAHYLKLANKHGLIATLGSDFHGGDIKPKVKIGLGSDGNLKRYNIEMPF